jgi:hypothetical protein
MLAFCVCCSSGCCTFIDFEVYQRELAAGEKLASAIAMLLQCFKNDGRCYFFTVEADQ